MLVLMGTMAERLPLTAFHSRWCTGFLRKRLCMQLNFFLVQWIDHSVPRTVEILRCDPCVKRKASSSSEGATARQPTLQICYLVLGTVILERMVGSSFGESSCCQRLLAKISIHQRGCVVVVNCFDVRSIRQHHSDPWQSRQACAGRAKQGGSKYNATERCRISCAGNSLISEAISARTMSSTI